MPTEDEVWESEDFQKALQLEKQLHRSEEKFKNRGFSPDIKATVGICFSCKNFMYAINDVHQLIIARCSDFRCQLGRHSIKKCSNYNERGKLPLDAMFQIAKLIDLDKIKGKAGFLPK